MHNLDLEKKTAVQPVVLASGRSAEQKLWSIGKEFNRQTNKFGFSMVKNDFQARKKKNEKAATSKLVGVKSCEIYRSGL